MIQRVAVKTVGVLNIAAACRCVRRITVDYQRTVLGVDRNVRRRTRQQLRFADLHISATAVYYRDRTKTVRRRNREAARHLVAVARVTAVIKTRFVHRLFTCTARAVVIRDHYRRAVIRTIDRYRQRRRALVTVGVGDRVHERIGQALRIVQTLHRRVRVVQRIGVIAVGIDLDAAVTARHTRAHIAAHGAARVTTRCDTRHRSNPIVIRANRVVLAIVRTVYHVARRR